MGNAIKRPCDGVGWGAVRQVALMGHTCKGAPAAGVEPLSLKCFRWGMGVGGWSPGYGVHRGDGIPSALAPGGSYLKL